MGRFSTRCLQVAGGEGEGGAAAEAFEVHAEVVGDDGEALGAAALKLAEQANERAHACCGEAAEALVPEQEEASRGGDPVDDGLQRFLLAGIGDVLEAVVEGEAALPAGEALALDDAAAELKAEGVAEGEGIGAADESFVGVEGGDGIVGRAERLAGAVEGDEGAEAGVLFEVGEGELIDVNVGRGEGLAAEEAAEGAGVLPFHG